MRHCWQVVDDKSCRQNLDNNDLFQFARTEVNYKSLRSLLNNCRLVEKQNKDAKRNKNNQNKKKAASFLECMILDYSLSASKVRQSNPMAFFLWNCKTFVLLFIVQPPWNVTSVNGSLNA